MEYTCKQCGKEFELTPSEIEFYESKNFELPKRCKECRTKNKQQKRERQPMQGRKPVQGRQPMQGRKPVQGRQPMQGRKPVQDRQPMQAGNLTKDRQQGQPQKYAKRQIQPKQFHQQTQNQPKAADPIQRNQNQTSPNSGGIFKYLAVAVLAVLILCGIFLWSGAGNNNNESSVASELSGQSLLFRNEEMLNEHYEKHGVSMGFASAKEYEAAACKVVENSDSLHKTEAEDGDDVYYLESTNEFVVVSTDGYIRTYFCPEDGMDYYNRQ